MGWRIFHTGCDGEVNVIFDVGTALALGVIYENNGEYRRVEFHLGPFGLTFAFPIAAYWSAP